MGDGPHHSNAAFLGSGHHVDDNVADPQDLRIDYRGAGRADATLNLHALRAKGRDGRFHGRDEGGVRLGDRSGRGPDVDDAVGNDMVVAVGRCVHIAVENDVADRGDIDPRHGRSLDEVDVDIVIGLQCVRIEVLFTRGRGDLGRDGLLSQPTTAAGGRVMREVEILEVTVVLVGSEVGLEGRIRDARRP